MDGEWLDFSFDPSHVALSVLVSFMGGLAAVELNETRRFETNVVARRKLALAVAAVVATSAIWCMHFVGMSALLLKSPSGELVSIRYRIDLTFASWVAAVAMQVLGVTVIAWRDPFFSATDHDAAVALVRKELLKKSFDTLTSNKPTRIVATIKIHWIVVGGFISGLGISAMHYLGMVSQVVMDAELTPRWEFIILSVWLAFSATTAAFWILFRLPLLYWDSVYLRLSSAALMALAVSSMHYTGMYGMFYEYIPGRAESIDAGTIDGDTESFIATFVSMSVFAAVIMWVLMRLRAEAAVIARSNSRKGTRSISTEVVPTSTMLSTASNNDSRSGVSRVATKYCFAHHKTFTGTIGRTYSEMEMAKQLSRTSTGTFTGAPSPRPTDVAPRNGTGTVVDEFRRYSTSQVPVGTSARFKVVNAASTPTITGNINGNVVSSGGTAYPIPTMQNTYLSDQMDDDEQQCEQV